MPNIARQIDSPEDLSHRVPENLRVLLDENLEFRDYVQGEQIVAPGDRGETIRFLLSGGASLVVRDSEGREIVVDAFQPGDLFGEISFLTGRPSPANAEVIAETECSVLGVSSEAFQRILRENPDFTLDLMKNLAAKIMRLDRNVFTTKLKKRALKSIISRQDHLVSDYVVGERVRRRIDSMHAHLAGSPGPILISGENGVGKEAAAHVIFESGKKYKDVFLLVDMHKIVGEYHASADHGLERSAPLDPTAEEMRRFFGYEGRSGGKDRAETAGYLELTDGGTLLVRGAELLTPLMQQRLLDAATTGTYCSFGGARPKKADVRLICTTCLDPAEITPAKHPLLYALLERSIVIPPLRKRRREIAGLVHEYLIQHSRELQKGVPEVPKQTLKTLLNYSWPGNDIELSNTLKRAALVCRDDVIRPEDISFDLRRIEGEGKLNLLNFKPVRLAVLSPLFPAILQSAVMPFFFILLALLFFGPADPNRNLGALFSWAVGWPALAIGAFFWGRFWCSVCPMGALGKLAKRIMAFERPVPPALKNRSDLLVGAAALFIIWLETATDMRNSPLNLGLLLAVILGLAVAASVYFERLSWCRYLCPLGGMAGILAKASMLELRADRNVCVSRCSSHDCYTGTAHAEGCPFGQVCPTLQSNLFCKICGNCIKNCPYGAVTLNLRAPAQELMETRQVSAVTAFLILGMLGGLLSEMFRKTAFFESAAGSGANLAAFTAVFFLGVVGVNSMTALAAMVSCRVYGDTFKENYSRYGLALLPLTLTAFAAFHIYYLINLGVQLPILASAAFDFSIFRQLIIAVPPNVTALIQSVLVWVGFAWSLIIIYKLGRASHNNFVHALLGIGPHAFVAFFLAQVTLHAMTEAFMR
jgi:DNA-binding NtrC family response regulator/ferredoxin